MSSFIKKRDLTLDIAFVRQTYFQAKDSEAATRQLVEVLKEATIAEPLLWAYRGAAQALKAKFVFNPFSKLEMVQKAHQMMTEAVNADPTDIEIRFVRFTIQTNLPPFLNLSREIELDKQAVMQHWEQNTKETYVQETIIAFLIGSGRCTPEEVEWLKSKLNTK